MERTNNQGCQMVGMLDIKGQDQCRRVYSTDGIAPTLSKAIAADAATIGIPAEVTFYDRLGITEEEVEQMKGELA